MESQTQYSLSQIANRPVSKPVIFIEQPRSVFALELFIRERSMLSLDREEPVALIKV